MRHMMSRFLVRRLAALALIFVIPMPAAADDAIMSVDQYKTAKARTLATTYQPLLNQMREEIYHCMPWVGVQKAGIGFRQPKGAVEDDRYLSVWIMIDQDEAAARRVIEWTGFRSVPTILVAERGKDVPYEAPAPLEHGASPRGIDRGVMITEANEDELIPWLKRHKFIPG